MSALFADFAAWAAALLLFATVTALTWVGAGVAVDLALGLSWAGHQLSARRLAQGVLTVSAATGLLGVISTALDVFIR